MLTIRPALLTALLLALCAGVLASPLPAFAAEEAEDGEGKEKGEKGKSEKDKNKSIVGGRFENDPIYVHVAPLIMPIINDKGVEQLVTLLVDIQVKDFDAAEKLQGNMPRIIDSLLQHLYGKLGEGNLKNGKLVNIGKIKKEAVLAVGKIIGAENVKDVLVQGVSQRML